MLEEQKDDWHGRNIARRRMMSEQVREVVRVLVVQDFVGLSYLRIPPTFLEL